MYPSFLVMIFPRNPPCKILCEQCERMRQPALIGGENLELHVDLVIRDINDGDMTEATRVVQAQFLPVF